MLNAMTVFYDANAEGEKLGLPRSSIGSFSKQYFMDPKTGGGKAFFVSDMNDKGFVDFRPSDASAYATVVTSMPCLDIVHLDQGGGDGEKGFPRVIDMKVCKLAGREKGVVIQEKINPQQSSADKFSACVKKLRDKAELDTSTCVQYGQDRGNNYICADKKNINVFVDITAEKYNNLRNDENEQEMVCQAAVFDSNKTQAYKYTSSENGQGKWADSLKLQEY